jgi:glycosyltransferase involved in cell wall biosynthesis
LSMARRQREPGPFRFVFAGRLIPLKRVDWLVAALAGLPTQAFELWIVGAGPDESALRLLAGSELGAKVRWLGQLPLTEVPAILAQADCLVLPSLHDGWGAVVSEALMAGTPVICSDACGSAGVVRDSGFGGVFRSDDRAALTSLLAQAVENGPLQSAERVDLADWAKSLGGHAGAAYLLQILDYSDGRSSRPLPPWSQAAVASCIGSSRGV